MTKPFIYPGKNTVCDITQNIHSPQSGNLCGMVLLDLNYAAFPQLSRSGRDFPTISGAVFKGKGSDISC